MFAWKHLVKSVLHCLLFGKVFYVGLRRELAVDNVHGIADYCAFENLRSDDHAGVIMQIDKTGENGLPSLGTEDQTDVQVFVAVDLCDLEDVRLPHRLQLLSWQFDFLKLE